MKLDPEFRDLLPRPSKVRLELIRDCIREKRKVAPLITWKDTLVDGYIRYEICQELDVPFECVEMEFESKEEAKFFKIRNQLIEREITTFQKCELLYPLEKFIAKYVGRHRSKLLSSYHQNQQNQENQENQQSVCVERYEPLEKSVERYEPLEKSVERDEPLDTGTIIAKYAGTTRTMWFRAKALIKKADESIKELLRTGELKIYPTYLRLQAGEPLIPSTEDAKEAEEAEEVEEAEKLVSRTHKVVLPNYETQDISDEDKVYAAQGIALDAQLDSEIKNFEEAEKAEGFGGSEGADGMDWNTDDVDIEHDPFITALDINNPDTQLPEAVPVLFDMPKRDPKPYPLVREQVKASIRYMLQDLLVGLCWLRDEDIDRRDEILEIVQIGYKKAKKLIERETKQNKSNQ